MVNNKKESGDKLPYDKPRLRTINLVADEVLGVKCKLSIGDPTGKKNHGGCGTIGVSGCYLTGS
jgi:hypothetical protein